MMPLRYKEERATQAAARLLKLRGGKMSYLKLLKLLYFADRVALVKLGRPITFDQYFSLENGPVLSRTCDLIKGQPAPGSPLYWRKYIEKSGVYDVRLRKEAPRDQLSPAEESILERVFKKYGHLSRWDLVKKSHKLPEYQDPRMGAIPISYTDILLGAGLKKSEARAIISDLVAAESFQGTAQ